MRSKFMALMALLCALAGCQAAATPAVPTAPPAAPTAQAEPTPAPATPAAPADQDPEGSQSGWTRRQFGTSWDIAYPEGWEVNDAGIVEGALEIAGAYAGHAYHIRMYYPIGLIETLDGWAEGELSNLTPEQRAGVGVADITVAGTPAKKQLNMPQAGSLGHQALIWKDGDKMFRQVTIVQSDGQPFDGVAMEALFDQFLAGIGQ